MIRHRVADLFITEAAQLAAEFDEWAEEGWEIVSAVPTYSSSGLRRTGFVVTARREEDPSIDVVDR